MPRTGRAPDKHARALPHRKRRLRNGARDEWLELPQPTLDELFHCMNESLEAATAFMQALRLMGIGMRELGRDEGEAVRTIAEATDARLHVMCDTWLDYIQAVRR